MVVTEPPLIKTVIEAGVNVRPTGVQLYKVEVKLALKPEMESVTVKANENNPFTESAVIYAPVVAPYTNQEGASG